MIIKLRKLCLELNKQNHHYIFLPRNILKISRIGIFGAKVSSEVVIIELSTCQMSLLEAYSVCSSTCDRFSAFLKAEFYDGFDLDHMRIKRRKLDSYHVKTNCLSKLAQNEVARLRDENLKSLLCRRKLCLVLDLDHTLPDTTTREKCLYMQQHAIGNLKGTLHCLDNIQMLTKLRPYVHTFLEMANLLYSHGINFGSRIIAREDCTQKNRKTLDVVLGHESAILILDDTSPVWKEDKENLVEMKRYHFFSSSVKKFGLNRKSLSEIRSDESEINGALATVLKTLRHIHSLYFDQLESNPDVRQV